MDYQFSAIQKASAKIYKPNSETSFKLQGVNGQQTNANNFHAAMTGLLTVVGLQARAMERDITQEVEESP